ncbi:MAG: hypothetical protein V1900_02450 [Candidatus Aenigmatarchaeota archaeon]
MTYSYSTPKLGFNGKYVLILIICIFLIASFYFITNRATTFATYTEGIEAELNKSKNDLIAVRSSLGNCELTAMDINYSLRVCEDKMSRSEFYVAACEKRTAELQNYSTSLNELLAKCENESKGWKASYENETTIKNAVIKNSVKVMCCSIYDTSKGTVKNWDLINNTIECDSGEYTVNCATGETNY